jgi:hypothetical protein
MEAAAETRGPQRIKTALRVTMAAASKINQERSRIGWEKMMVLMKCSRVHLGLLVVEIMLGCRIIRYKKELASIK